MDPTPTSELVDHLIDFFDEVAEGYDDWAGGLHCRLAARLLEFADPQPGQAVLDVGTGTGLVAHLASERVGPQGLVVGIDLSERMLDVARRAATANSRFIGMAA